MNRRTFNDAVTSRVSSLANDIEDVEDDDEKDVQLHRGNIEGEEEDGDEFDEDGEALEPFNLKSDREAGYFDENMNFVFRKNKGEIDNWLANMNETEMEKAIGEAANAVKKQAAKIDTQADKQREELQRKSMTELKREILRYLRAQETIAAAMRRLSGRGKEPSYNGNKRRMPPKDNAKASIEESTKKSKETLNRLTDIANELLSRGLTSIYELSYEAIDASTSSWEYKGQDGVIHGPYTSQQIAEWKAQGYFTGNTAVLMRKASSSPSNHGTTSQNNPSSNSLLDDIYSDDEDASTRNHPSNHKTHESREREWILSDDIDFGQPNDFPSNDTDRLPENDTRGNDRHGKRSTRVQFAEDDNDYDPDLDGDVNKKSTRNRKRMKFDVDDDDD